MNNARTIGLLKGIGRKVDRNAVIRAVTIVVNGITVISLGSKMIVHKDRTSSKDKIATKLAVTGTTSPAKSNSNDKTAISSAVTGTTSNARTNNNDKIAISSRVRIGTKTSGATIVISNAGIVINAAMTSVATINASNNRHAKSSISMPSWKRKVYWN